ncbi:hypothetical protein SDC9_208956 [bioreactor metagenome]|uniref:DUF4162 domain-containing protein n=2 Tax=root TaxID=1 RepID=A0A645JDG7_9ZZZZ
MGLETNAYKNVTVTSPEERLKQLDNLSGLEIKYSDAGQREYLFRGDMALLIRELNQAQVSNLTIEDPSLEEIFMHYYE